MFKNLKKNKKGFSLVELIVVIAIMAVLVGVLAPTLLTNIEKSRESKDIQVLDSVASAVQMALADEKAEAKKPAGKVTLSSVLDAQNPDAFQAAVKENLGGKSSSDIKLSSASATASGNDIYISVDGTGTVTVEVLASATATTPVQAAKSKNDLKVVR